MEYKVIWSEKALADLFTICRYIAERNADAARKLGNLLINRTASLRSNPYAWPPFRPVKSGSVHSFRQGNYRIFYEIDEKRRVVDVLRIRHGARAPLSPDELR